MTARRFALYSVAAISLAVAGWQLGSAGLIAGKAWLAPILIDRAWAKTLDGERQVAPWGWADTWPVAELTAPKQDVRRLILSNTSMRNLAFGPTMDRRGDTRILYAHRDTHFRFLKDVAVGDHLSLKDETGKVRDYVIREAAVMDKQDLGLPKDLVGRDALMLITCYPFDDWQPNGPLRYVVWAERDQPLADGQEPG
ncbi:sortase domain-containing protein [Aestuariispira ectoiniformans]|uniref:sortase domain-containing protein n=1 Tax=Aestuariispira ectoiniformans TaxID=2775080 RepID=UPI00223BA0E8|nr:sortase [Aestuariispira ectoiniformans]